METPYADFFRIAQFIALLLFIPIFDYMLGVYKQEKKWRLFTLAFVFWFLSTIFAIVREFYLFDVFRLLEQLSVLMASIVFAYTCYYSNTYLRGGEVK
jgi:hypothetical protein